MISGHKSARALIWALCLMAGSVFAQSSLPACSGNFVYSDWSYCQGRFNYRNYIYSGEFLNNLPHGVGEKRNFDGSIIDSGVWKNGELVNKSLAESTSFGQKATPEIEAERKKRQELEQQLASNKERERIESSLPACQGSDVARWTSCFGTTTYFISGDKYVGEFKDGKRYSQGTYTFANGNKYVGEWRDDLRNGQGTFTFANGNKYVGEYKDDIGNGQGTFTLANGFVIFVGEYKDDKANGQGTYTYADGNKYVGEFKDGAFNGQGTYTFANGNKYVGEYKDDKRNGQGIEYSPSGSITTQGRWENGIFVQSFAVDTQRFPFNVPSQTASATPVPDLLKTERDRLASELEASRKNAKDLEERLAAAQALTNNPPNLSQPVAANVRSAHALIIGNAAYPGSGRLDNPVNDAKAISQKLRSMGFTVTTVTDANRQKLVQSMAQFRRTAAAADISLLFYSGHGVQIFGTNYMLPTDVDQTDPAQATIQGVSLNSVVENFLPGKTKLVFLDACRDNALQRTTDRSVSKGLAPISAAEGTLISYATKDGQTASDGVGAKNSPFTQALLQHLDDPADIAVVLRKVREKVMQATAGKQQPWEYGSLTGGELVLSKIKGGR